MNRQQKIRILQHTLKGYIAPLKAYRMQADTDPRLLTDAQLEAIIKRGMTDKQLQEWKDPKAMTDDQLRNYIEQLKVVQTK